MTISRRNFLAALALVAPVPALVAESVARCGGAKATPGIVGEAILGVAPGEVVTIDTMQLGSVEVEGLGEVYDIVAYRRQGNEVTLRARSARTGEVRERCYIDLTLETRPQNRPAPWGDWGERVRKVCPK